MRASLGPNLEIDVDRLLVSRLLIQAEGRAKLKASDTLQDGAR